VHLRQSGFLTAYKRDVVGNVIRFFSGDFVYDPVARLDAEVVTRSQLFLKEGWTGSSGHDLLTIRLDGLPEIRLCELHLWYTRSSGEGTETNRIFDGLFVTMDLADKPPVQAVFTQADPGKIVRELPADTDPYVPSLLERGARFSFEDKSINLAVPSASLALDPDLNRGTSMLDDVQTFYAQYQIVFHGMRALATPFL